MSFTPEQRAKALASRMANKAKREAAEANKVAKLAATTGMSGAAEAALRSTIVDLEIKLAAAMGERSAAEKSALLQAEAQGSMLGTAAEEVPTGRTRKVKRFKEWKSQGFKDNGDEILKPIFRPVEEPTYFYRVNMAPCGGDKFVLNGEEFYHGATYEFDIDTLRTVKEIVFRTWAHDRDIHGSDENFYRGKNKDFNPLNRISARGV